MSEHVRDSGRVEASSGEDLLRGVPHPRGAEAGRERGGHGEGAQVGGGWQTCCPAGVMTTDTVQEAAKKTTISAAATTKWKRHFKMMNIRLTNI